jgi:hypothetical protein
VGSRLSSIRDRVRLLSAIDVDRQVFGAETHDYAFAPAITSLELAALEALFGELPHEYRAVIGELGAHGAGPYYGLLVPTVPEDPSGVAPDPKREFRCDIETGYQAHRDGEHVLDGTLVLAEQGCGGRSLLVIRGPRRGEVWSDWTREQGTISPEAPNLLTWYEDWLDRAMLEWVEEAAPRIALEGPDDPSELEAIASVFELVERHAPQQQGMLRTLGYLHLREGRWEDASTAFDAAATAGGKEPDARRHLDRARMHIARDENEEAILDAERGLATPGLWHSTRDELREVLERVLGAVGRRDEALAVLDERAGESYFSFTHHHRLARERLSRGDIAGAGSALERAAGMPNILGTGATHEERIAASFEPIIAELRVARRESEARALIALVERISDAN